MPDAMEWLVILNDALDERQKQVAEYRAWYEGNHPLPTPPSNTFAGTDAEARRAFENMAKLGVMNFLAPVVDAPASKLRIEGFRFGEQPVSSDAQAWAIWERNNLTGDSDLSTHEALQVGQAFAIVWADSDGQATITVEDPAACIVAYQSGSRRARAAGLKRWVDDYGYLYANVYLPDGIYKFQATMKSDTKLIVVGKPGDTPKKWEPRLVDGEEWPLANPTGKVALHEIRANPQLRHSRFGGGRPEFLGQLNEQRKINHTVLQMLITMEHQAFRQRWVTGWGAPTKEDGTPDKHMILKASAAALMIFPEGVNPGEEVKVGEFSQADFAPFLAVIDRWVKAIASTSGTPPYAFLLGDMINVAADSLARIEGVQTNKIAAHGRTFGIDYTEILLAALAIENNPKAQDPSASVVWCEPEERTATEQANLAQIMRNLGAPDEVVYSTLPGVSQQEAKRWIANRGADMLIDSAFNGDSPAVSEAADIKAKADAMGVLIRAGVDPDDAAARVGLPGVKFTGAVPVSLRLPTTDAAGLEQA